MDMTKLTEPSCNFANITKHLMLQDTETPKSVSRNVTKNQKPMGSSKLYHSTVMFYIVFHINSGEKITAATNASSEKTADKTVCQGFQFGMTALRLWMKRCWHSLHFC